MSDFNTWVERKLKEYTEERPRPVRQDYPYDEAYESALWAWNSCYETRVYLYRCQEEGFKAGVESMKCPEYQKEVKHE